MEFLISFLLGLTIGIAGTSFCIKLGVLNLFSNNIKKNSEIKIKGNNNKIGDSKQDEE